MEKETLSSEIVCNKKAKRFDQLEKYNRRKRLKALRKLHKRKNRKKRSQRPVFPSKVIRCLELAHFSYVGIEGTGIVKLSVPQCFCFSRDPDNAIKFLRKLYSYAMNPKIKEIRFNHLNCNCLGVCASTIMDIILLECKKYRASIKNPILYSGFLTKDGKVSKDDDVDKLLKTSGLLRHLKISDLQLAEIERLELIKNEESAMVAEKIIEYINKTLHRHKLELTPLGKNYFGKLLGEIADNCTQHGGKYATWYTLGHYSIDKKTGIGKCKLVIFDLGDTIYQGLKQSPMKMQRRIDHYVRKARTFFPQQESEETLYTLFSLQQRVSRFEQKDIVRGNGTITFIDAFQNIFESDNPKAKSLLSITSGKCNILFDGTYRLKTETFGTGYKNQVIAFNAENKLNKAPDRRFVRTLRNSFPGTVISMELYIDDALLTKNKHL